MLFRLSFQVSLSTIIYMHYFIFHSMQSLVFKAFISHKIYQLTSWDPPMLNLYSHRRSVLHKLPIGISRNGKDPGQR